jgi:hypothetical protein
VEGEMKMGEMTDRILTIFLKAHQFYVRYEVLMKLIMNISVFWNVTPNSLVNFCQHFGGICCLNLQGTLKMKVADSFFVLVTIYMTARRHVPLMFFFRHSVFFIAPEISFYLEPHTIQMGHAVAYLVEALRYKTEGRGFES